MKTLPITLLLFLLLTACTPSSSTCITQSCLATPPAINYSTPQCKNITTTTNNHTITMQLCTPPYKTGELLPEGSVLALSQNNLTQIIQVQHDEYVNILNVSGAVIR